MPSLTGPFPTELWIAIISTISSPATIWPLRAVNTTFRHIALAAVFKVYTGQTISLESTDGAERAIAVSVPPLEISLTSKCQAEPETYVLRPLLSSRLFHSNGELPMVIFRADMRYEEEKGFRGFARLVVETAKAIQNDVEALEEQKKDDGYDLRDWIESENLHADLSDTAYTGEEDGDLLRCEFGEIPNRLGPVAAFLKSGRASLTGHVGNFSQPLRFSYDLLLGHILSTYERVAKHHYLRADPQLSLLALTWRVIQVIAPSTSPRDLYFCTSQTCCKHSLTLSFSHPTWTQKSPIDHPFASIIRLPQSESTPIWSGTYGDIGLRRTRHKLPHSYPPAFVTLTYLSHNDSDHASLVDVEVEASVMWLLRGEIVGKMSGLEEAFGRLEKAVGSVAKAFEVVGGVFRGSAVQTES